MERKISTSLYALAFVATAIVFSLGVLVGQLIDGTNQQLISDEVDDLTQKLESTQLLMLLDENSTSFCPVYKSQVDSINLDIEKIGHKLSYLEEQKQAYDVTLKKNYFILEAQSYFMSKKLNEKCGENSTLLLYFYSNKNCVSCKKQGNDILAVRDSLNSDSIKIYSFDGDLESSVADALKTQFNITEYPSIIINDKLYSGAQDQATLRSVLSGS
jgi:hypothetical protein